MNSLPKIFAGTGLEVARNALGNMLSWRPSRKWSHPWQTTAKWDADGKQWKATVLAGFVNGVPPVVNLTIGTAPALTVERAKKRGTDTTNAKAQIWSPLTDTPYFGLQLRAIGVDDPTGAAVPPFFAALGVHQGVAFDPTQVNQQVQQVPPDNRLRCACDVVLQQPRYALTSDVTVGDPVVDGYSVIQTLSLLPPSAAQRLMVYATSQWTPPDPQLDIEDGTYEEPTYDEIKVATVYLLSPPGEGNGSVPDGSWTAYYEHNLFWNLSWAQNTNIQQPLPDPISFVIALPSGILFQPLINTLLSYDNDTLNAIEADIASHSLEGQFWSHGGCSPLPAATPTTPEYALDKFARNAAAQASQRAQPAPLDPQFPYSCQAFPSSLLS